MSLELSSIVFKATTDELDAAVKKIEVLGKSVEGLATSLGKLDKSSVATNKTQAQANLLNAKAEKELAKAIDITDKTTAANEKLTKATKERQSVEERQAAITRLMAEGNSRGQASILATAEALGEATEKTNEYLKAQRAMSSNNPFDRSLGAATVFANELKVATVASDLYNKDLGFTKNQLQELGREHVRLTEQFKVQGKSLSGLDAEFQKIVQSAQQVTQAENTMAASMKNGQKATTDAGKANTYIENELQKVRFALQANNEELNRSTANSLVRFENALKKSGLTLDQQKLKIDEYRRSQIELQKTQKANQTDYITRAVGPQITDIIVGLSTGQSPLTVMMQQGGQLRDQFGMMGVAAKDMGDVMRNAMKGMASSVFDTGKAITTMLAGGMFDAGKAVVNLGMDITGMNSVLEYSKKLLAAQGEEGFKYIGMLNRAGAVLTGVFAVGIAAGVISVLALGIAFMQVTKAQDDLTKSLVSSGAQLGLSSTDAFALAESFRGVGTTSVEILTAFKQISESGKISRESLVAVAEAALILESAGGKAASKTIEMFAKLADKPMETLSEYAQKTGLVDQAEMQRIDTLVKLGQEITATEEATKILAKATEDEAAIMLASLSDVSRLWLTVKGGISEAWRAVQEFAGSAEVMSVVKVVLQTVAVVATEVWYGIKGIGESLGGLGAIAAAVMTDIKNLDTNFTASKGMLGMIEEQDKARESSYKDSIARIMQEGKYSREELDSTARLAAAGRKTTAEAEKDRVAHELAMKPWREQEQKSLADNLTKREFIKQAIDKTNKALTEGKTLRAEEIAQITKLAGADWDKSNKQKKVQLTDEQKAENKALESYVDTMNKAYGINKDYNNQLAGFQLLRKNGKITEEEYVKVVEDLIKQQKFYTDGLAQEEKQLKLVQKAWADTNKEQEKKDNEYLKSYDSLKAQSAELKKGTSEIEFQFGLLGKTEEQQKLITREHKLQGDLANVQVKLAKELLEIRAKGFDPADEANLEVVARQNAAEKIKAINAGVALQAAQDMMKEFDAIKSSITDVIVTALFDGGKAGSKKLRDQVVQAFRNKITVVIDAAVNTLMGSAASSLLGGNKEGGIGTLSNVTSLASLASSIGTVGSQVVTGAMSLTNAIGTIGANATGTGISGLLASNAAFGTAAPTSMSTITGAIGAIPGWGWALMAGVAVAAMLEGGETRSGATYGTGANGKAVKLEGPSGGEIASTQVQKMFNTAKSSIEEMLTGFGSKAVLTGFTAGLESSEGGKGFAFAGGQINGVGFGEYKGRSGGQFAMGDKTTEQAVKDFELNLTQSILEGLQVTEDIPTSIAKLITDGLNGDEVKNLSQEAVNTILNSISTLTKSVNLFNGAMTHLPFEYLKNLSFDAAEGLIAASGGLESLMGNLSGFYDNFYTESEKTTNLTNSTSAAFAKLNIEMPAINESTREWYRSEVERLGAMDLSIEANAKAYASVLGLQGAVNQLAPTFDDVARSVAEAVEKMAESVKSAQDVSVQMGITTAYTLAQSRAQSAYDKALKAAPGLVGYTQEDIVRYAASGNRTELDKQTWGVIDELVGAIGNWASAQEAERNRLNSGSSGGSSGGSSPVTPVDVIDKSIQATIDYNIALAEAQGNTIEAARLQRELSNATKLAAGWTKLQIDTLNSAIDAAAAALKIKDALSTLATATSALDTALNAIRETAKNAQAAVDAAKQEITSGYLSAVDQQLQAQEAVNSLIKQSAEEMRGFSVSIREFLLQMATTDIGADSKLQQLSSLLQDFNVTADLARGGDTKAYGSITGKAQSLLTAGKEQFSTLAEFARFSSNVGNTLEELATLADGKAGPLGEAVDPMVKAQKELLRANQEVLKWTKAINESGASTEREIKDYAQAWRVAQMLNITAQSELKASQELTKESSTKLINVLEDLKVLIASVNSAKTAVTTSGGTLPVTAGTSSSSKLVQDAYASIGRAGAGSSESNIDLEGYSYWVNQLSSGALSTSDFQNTFLSAAAGVTGGYANASSLAQELLNMNSFAVGTNYVPSDMTANIHQGERIIPAADNQELMQRLSSPMTQDNSELVREIQYLNNRLAIIESNTASTAGHAAKTARLLDRAMPDGDALATRTAEAI